MNVRTRWIGAVVLFGMGAVYAFGAAPVFWRSQLYPMDWRPGFADGEGRFLHDFSYAGYHNGEVSLPSNVPGTRFDVVADFAADNTGAGDATAAIQAAIDAAEAAGGGVVYFPAGLYQCSGTLHVGVSGIVIQGAGAAQSRVYFTKVDGMANSAHLSFTGTVQQSDERLLAADGVNGSQVVYLDDASGLAVGDDIAVGWVITDAFIAEHGMTGTWSAFNGLWRPIFRRQIVAIDMTVTPHAVTVDVPLRYPAKMRDSASVRRETGYLSECGVESIGIANAVDYAAAWSQAQVHAIQFTGVKDGWVRNVQTFVSPADPQGEYHLQNSGIRLLASKRFTIADCILEKAQNRGGSGCGYLYHITTSNEVLIRDCIGRWGRHNFIQNWDFGTTGCVFLRCETANGRIIESVDATLFSLGSSEYHHSLAMACLVDQCTVQDGWSGVNRGTESTGAGHSVTENVFWNTTGSGVIRSWAYGWGYVIGTQDVRVYNDMSGFTGSEGTEPADFLEGNGQGAALFPRSLYEDQLARRLNRPDTDGDGISDAAETTGATGYLTSATNPDTDGDGLADGDEISGRYGWQTDPAQYDTDGDSFSDYEESVVRHTDPTDSRYPQVAAFSVPFFVFQ